MPFRPRFEFKEPQVACDFLGGIALPRTANHDRRHKRLNVAAGALQLLARLNADLHAFGPNAASRDARMHLGIDVNRGKKRIEGRGRRMKHKGVVHLLMRHIPRLPFHMGILFVNL